MQYVTPEYKESMKAPLRERGYMRVTFGGVNIQAQNNTVISGDQLSYSNPAEVFNNGNDNYVYATLEKDFTKVDGSMYFATTSRQNILEKAFISEDLIDDENPYTFTITFENGPVSFDTIIFNFGDNYPLSFTIEDDLGNSYDYENDTGRIYQIEQTFEDVSELTVTITEMLNNNRFRLYSIRFDAGYEYQNDMILDSMLNSSVSPIGENLPQMNFNVKLVNEDHFFDTDNPKSILNQFNTSTEVNIYYGYQLPGRVEWLQAARLFVESWDSDQESATIYARDILQTMDKDYTGANYNSITLYNLAVAILTEMGITDYDIDASLSNITTKNALEGVTCKQGLQIIANAACKKLFIKRDGSIRIGDELLSYTFSDNGVVFTPVSSIGVNDTKYSYASLEQNFTKIDGTMYFVTTSSSSYKNVGYVSKQISNGKKNFEKPRSDVGLSEQVLFGNIVNLAYELTEYPADNPIITITLADVAAIGGMRIIFGDTYAAKFIVRGFDGNTVVDEITVENDQKELTVDFNFICDKIEVEFIETAQPYNRVHVNFIELFTGSNIEYDDMNIMSYPKFTKFETVQRIVVPYYTYTQSSGKWSATETDVYEDINDQGSIIKWENPLITTQAMAENLLAWLKEYYLSEGTYEFDTRGDPEVDANDNALQKKYNGKNMQVLITDISLGFNGAFSGSVTTLKKGAVE